MSDLLEVKDLHVNAGEKEILNGQIDKAYKLIEEWYGFIKSKLLNEEKAILNPKIKIESDLINELTIIKNGYLDIVFENIFIEDEKLILFDQEWYLEGIPLEFILYRSINNLYVYNQEINKIIPYPNMMDKFGLNKYMDIFKSIEKYIQMDVIDEKMDNVNKLSLSKLIDINQVAIMKNQINDYQKEDKIKEQYIKSLESQVEALKSELQNVNEINKKQNFHIKYLEQENSKSEKKKIWKWSK